MPKYPEDCFGCRATRLALTDEQTVFLSEAIVMALQVGYIRGVHPTPPQSGELPGLMEAVKTHWAYKFATVPVPESAEVTHHRQSQ